jgi:hypothetical protein
VAVGVLTSIVETRWERRYQPAFILIMAFLTFLHIFVLALVPIPKFGFGLVVLPFAMIDAYAMWALVAWVDRPSGTDDPRCEDQQDLRP